MDYKVKEILEKYWEGESSLEEEKALKAYFNQEVVAKELEQYRSLFTYFSAQEKIAMSADVQTIIDKKIAEAPAAKKIVKFPTTIWRMAAAIALLVGFFFFYQQAEAPAAKTIAWEDTYETPEEAYVKVKEVLSLVSRKMKTGTDKAAKSISKAQIATKIIKE